MKLLQKVLAFGLFLSITSYAQEIKTFTIKVEVVNVSNNKGKMFFALHDSENNFLKKEIKGDIQPIHNNKSVAIFKDVPEGIYAVSVFHDENNNGKLDTNVIGIPTESFGCSNNAKGFMGPPKWKNAKFKLLDKNIDLEIKL